MKLPISGAEQIILLQHQNSDKSDNELTVVNKEHVRARLRLMLIWKFGFDPYSAGSAEPFPAAIDTVTRHRLRALIVGRYFDDVGCDVSASSLSTAETFDKLIAAVWNAIPRCHKERRRA